MSPDEIQAPVQLSAVFLWIGIGTFVLIVLVLLIMMWFTRNSGRRSAAVAPPVYGRMPHPGGDPIRLMRDEYHAKIAQVEMRYRERQIDDRDAHLELSAIIRSFAERRAGEPATKATLAEIRKLPISKSLANLIEHFYAPAFGPEGEGSTMESIEAARTVVHRW